MQSRTLAAAGVALLVVATGAAVLAGVVPLPGSGDPVAGPPTPTTGAGTPGTATPGDGTPTTEFRMQVRSVEECGTTCRDVTLALTNVGSAAASGVTVRTELFAGNGTDEGDRIWTGSEDVGSLAAGETYTATKRVTLSMSEGLAVQQADGWVTVRTTIRTDDGSVTFVDRRDVN